LLVGLKKRANFIGGTARVVRTLLSDYTSAPKPNPNQSQTIIANGSELHNCRIGNSKHRARRCDGASYVPVLLDYAAMKRHLALIVGIVVLLGAAAVAQQVVPLYPGLPPGSQPADYPEKDYFSKLWNTE